MESRKFSILTQILFSVSVCISFTLLTQEIPQDSGYNIDLEYQNLSADNKDDNFFYCSPLAGEALLQCFIGLNPYEQGRTLSRLAFKQRRQILKRLAYEQFESFISECSDAEWQELYKRLTPLEQKNVPSELDAIKRKLQEIHFLAFLSDVGTKLYAVSEGADPVFAGIYLLIDLGYYLAGKSCTVYTITADEALQNYFKKTFLKDK